MNLEEMTDEELSRLVERVNDLLENRHQSRYYGGQIDRQIIAYAEESGRDLTAGVAWEAPGTVLDTYPTGQVVTCEHGNRHESALAANFAHPCEDESAWPLAD